MLSIDYNLLLIKFETGFVVKLDKKNPRVLYIKYNEM